SDEVVEDHDLGRVLPHQEVGNVRSDQAGTACKKMTLALQHARSSLDQKIRPPWPDESSPPEPPTVDAPGAGCRSSAATPNPAKMNRKVAEAAWYLETTQRGRSSTVFSPMKTSQLWGIGPRLPLLQALAIPTTTRARNPRYKPNQPSTIGRLQPCPQAAGRL